jgi:hypothetical protein
MFGPTLFAFRLPRSGFLGGYIDVARCAVIVFVLSKSTGHAPLS